ncbi:hypothetical protein ASPZODRAFT_135381 [Penicilliopsis zonata CBS 506.65]|uniref:Enoyl reductase (ER) domain-containing protein n=1 Tax=Penicilliopsis zonata CBS 506.65 TaxID=1073090 RepID=A0A1L9SA04_9EURO|nr:hypothetical protein ASPZODRAFT_135381 [Penicilliopsis zonata CBS 506.65]OJJ43966.1 hypothetical protein ASPZODRAFT_135381 [Penicilliopsis zonata CBS 506.65]
MAVSSMSAWLYSSAANGLEKNLTLSATARAPPAPKKNQLLIQVLAASINPADYKVPEMPLITRLVLKTPASPGMDFCGRIVAVGPDTDDDDGAGAAYTTGQLVFGCLGMPSQFGTLGEYIVAKTSQVALLPEGVDPNAAATLGIAGQTAYQSVAPYVKQGDKVFINAGSGGCGMFAIQIAKALGCSVTTTCSTRNLELCRELGADQVIDYTAENVIDVLAAQGMVYDHVVDHVSQPDGLYRESHRFLREGKTYVQVGADSVATFLRRSARPSLLGGGRRKYVVFFFANTRDHLVQLGEWLAQGKVRVQIDSVFPREEAVQAFEKLRSHRARGKIIVRMSE